MNTTDTFYLEREIELSREFRTRRVANVVTGKRVVCTAASEVAAKTVADVELEEIETEDSEE